MSTNSALTTSEFLSGPRILIIGAGSRGNAYARAIKDSTNGVVAAVAEPVDFKREALGRKYIWADTSPSEGQHFRDWKDFLYWEVDRRKSVEDGNNTVEGVDGVFVCTLDESHAEIITGLAPLNLHILSEKPLATTLQDCVDIYGSLLPKEGAPSSIFAIGHVLRYSPHNMLLRRLLLEDEVIGETMSIEHTEPVGWWHFSHSYVRGNWRKESKTAPSLLTKSCHDIDLLLWLLCSPPPGSDQPPHLPSFLTSTGSLVHFKRSRKPALAAGSTNCLSCPAERDCIYSAKQIYHEQHLMKGNTQWPIKIIDPEIEDCLNDSGLKAAEDRLFERLREDYDAKTPSEEVDSRPWFGRCVYESGNDVCDNQMVTMTWEDDPLPTDQASDVETRHKGRGAKTASFHMVAFTEKICERRSRIYGTKGEIEADSKTIKVYDFATKQTKTHHPHQAGGGHGGGDDGLATQFVKAIVSVKNHGMTVEEAQRVHIGCSPEEIIRSHAMVFAAEDARKGRRVVDWRDWWAEQVEARLRKRSMPVGRV
ncbi:MAG: hypothetical protein M1812_004845 [Candelaria pacifica]|nr:MAG: hypothetical protein M1812_004845 [Candelaria pacifica]